MSGWISTAAIFVADCSQAGLRCGCFQGVRRPGWHSKMAFWRWGLEWDSICFFLAGIRTYRAMIASLVAMTEMVGFAKA